jgi:uncharacterized membrane protein YkvA (DUF1232 family)
MKNDLRRRIMKLSWRNKLTLVGRFVRHPEVPARAKAVMPATMLYLASPIDLIPDFIPVLGQLDDILVLGLALGLVVSLTPRDVLEDLIDGVEYRDGVSY